MSISWYPGHMHKAKKELVSIMQTTDIVIEVLDARIPRASSNPLLSALRLGKPCLGILNKADLANPQVTKDWCNHIASRPASACLVNGLDTPLAKDEIVKACQKLVKKTPSYVNQYQILITGIPNVGKSTLLNQISGRSIAKTGNEPAVTKGQQRVKLDDNWYLIDTPGMMWPKLENQDGAYRLAATGAIRNTAIEAQDIAWFLAQTLLVDFYPNLQSRYKLDLTPTSVEDFFTQLAKRSGCLKQGSRVDWNKVSELLLNDFRAGRLGRLSLETPN